MPVMSDTDRPTGSLLTWLECPECRQRFDPDRVQSICTACRSPLLARYDLQAARRIDRDALAARPGGLWRWRELLPVRALAWCLTLGEGATPLLAAPRAGARIGLPLLAIKDESGNPTGTFKARGLAVAVARAAELGLEDLVIPTAGNAGGALAAYAARAGLSAHVFMPQDAPPVNRTECRLAGAEVVAVDGLISDAGRLAAEAGSRHGWLDVSTLKEPYRLEGKKTMGFELAHDGAWQLPDVIIYPTGGGTGLLGLWKAFDELEALGWIGPDRPRLVAVQAAGCAPVVQAFEQGAERCTPWPDAHTLAAGLRVPMPFADRLILRALRASEGTALAVDDEAILAAQRQLAADEGLFVCPEGAATLAAAARLAAAGWIDAGERVTLLNTGSGLKYSYLLDQTA
jgi:threonine synthase